MIPVEETGMGMVTQHIKQAKIRVVIEVEQGEAFRE